MKVLETRLLLIPFVEKWSPLPAFLCWDEKKKKKWAEYGNRNWEFGTGSFHLLEGKNQSPSWIWWKPNVDFWWNPNDWDPVRMDQYLFSPLWIPKRKFGYHIEVKAQMGRRRRRESASFPKGSPLFLPQSGGCGCHAEICAGYVLTLPL